VDGSNRLKEIAKFLPFCVQSPTTSVPLSLSFPLNVAPVGLALNVRTPPLSTIDSSGSALSASSGLPHLPENDPFVPLVISSVMRNVIWGVTMSCPCQFPSTPSLARAVSGPDSDPSAARLTAKSFATAVSHFMAPTPAATGSLETGAISIC
jgi:hypothetical protein